MCTTAQPCQIMLCTRLVYSCNVTPRQRGSNAFLSFAPSLFGFCFWGLFFSLSQYFTISSAVGPV
jgi:hypothetical protein